MSQLVHLLTALCTLSNSRNRDFSYEGPLYRFANHSSIDGCPTETSIATIMKKIGLMEMSEFLAKITLQSY